MQRGAARSDLNATLQSKLSSCTEGDIEWTAFHQLLEYLAPLVRAEKAVMRARGYRGQDVQVVVPAARKAEIEAAAGKRELSLKRHAANGIPLQQPVTLSDGRSDESRVGMEVVGTSGSRGARKHKKKKH